MILKKKIVLEIHVYNFPGISFNMHEETKGFILVDFLRNHVHLKHKKYYVMLLLLIQNRSMI